MTSKRRDLTQGDINNSLKSLTIPMVFGILGIIAFNLADTYFVSKLGTKQMAALTFTFPVVLILNSLNLGLGIGASAIISKAVGEKNQEKVTRLSTDSLSLGIVFAVIAMVIGFFTIDPVFTALGADPSTMVHVREYMTIWYAGVPFIVIPMIGNNAIRALGDTKTPSLVMLVSAGVNIVLDPLFIFGFAFIPAMGVQGAAIATVSSRFITFLFSLYILIFREKVISLKAIHIKELIDSWKDILYIGLPNAISKMIMPIGIGIITGLIATFGTGAVAGFGIASRIEYFSLILISSLSSVLPVFVGQNFGAGKINRIITALKISEKFSFINGLVSCSLLFLLARPLAHLFTTDQAVIDTLVIYLRIVPFGYAFQGVILVITSGLNALRKPLEAALINLGQMLLIYIPLAKLTASYWGIKGIFASLVISYLIMSSVAFVTFRKIASNIKSKGDSSGPQTTID